MHNEQYHELNANEIKDVYSHKESLEVNNGFVKENNKETLAQVFTDVRYPKDTNELFSDKLIKFLKEQDYL